VKLPDLIPLDLNLPDIAVSLSAVPLSPGVYLLAIPDSHVHLGSSGNLRRRLTRLLALSYPATANVTQPRLHERLAGVGYLPTGSKLESALLTYQITRRYFPSDYMKRLRLRLPWFVYLETKDPFAFVASGNRPAANNAVVLGPFVSRDVAQTYEQEVSGLFQLRRCTEILQPSEGHPGCIYGEMAQCLRPCQLAVTPDEYHSETERVTRFLLGNGRAEISDLTVARDRAIEGTEFEQAHVLHARVEKLKAAAALRPEIIRNLGQFTGVAVVPAHEPNTVKLWPLLVGHWQDPICLTFTLNNNTSKSLDSALKEQFRRAWEGASKDWNPLEAIAVFARWYYSSHRDGHWLPFTDPENLSYRKLVRSISQLVKEKLPIDVRS
jgi:excinuclease ABC subunit C